MNECDFEGQTIFGRWTEAPEKEQRKKERGQKAEKPAHSASRQERTVQEAELVCRFVAYSCELDPVWR